MIAPSGAAGYNRGVRIDLGVRLDPAALVAGPDGTGVRRLVPLARLAEAEGADAVLLAGDDRRLRAGTVLPADPYVLLGALAEATERVALGCLAAGTAGRPPSLLAKLAASLDVCSDGRALAALAGPGEPPLEPASLGEALEVVRAMLRVPGPSLSGARFAIRRAHNEPRAAGDEPVPLALYVAQGDAEADGALLELGARYAELTFVALRPGGEAALAGLAERFSSSARAAGRVPATAVLEAVLEAAPEEAPGALAGRVATARASGAAGVVVDLCPPYDDALERRLAAAIAAARAGGAGGGT
ncbi:MAG TPA: LLM class flavin-dependent oxidoreductase [Acidimicrobiales bacterium]|nr:LLM class flavin-dependent oxidoreductase [Acidimicrobiales bacterium]